jgi:hypothetical protein
LYVLLTKLRHVYASGDSSRYLIPDEALTAFMAHCGHRIGDAYFRTPRTTIKEFINLLAVLDQNPGADWRAIIGQIDLAPESNPDLEPLPDEAGRPLAPVTVLHPGSGTNDELTTFRL